MNREEMLSNLILTCIFLSSWEESEGDVSFLRTWKNYRFEILDSLEDAGLITHARKGKSVYLTDKGIERAKELVEVITDP